jgi:hypothetical protein
MQCLKPTRIWGYRGKFMETQWKYDGSFTSIYVDLFGKTMIIYDNLLEWSIEQTRIWAYSGNIREV